MSRRTRFQSGILWQGPSPIDGAPIVAIATGDSDNRKTGNMVQVWILRADVSPVDAVRSGADESVCGSCPMRGKGFAARACYVNVGQAPSSVYRAFVRGVYPEISPESFVGRKVRLGAYGDPTMIPFPIVRRVIAVASGWTGYTHQWALPFAAPFKGLLMASVESAKGDAKARKAGWGTFRVGLAGEDMSGAVVCRNERDGTACADCLECDGSARSIFIPAHGNGKDFVPAARLARKAAAYVQ